MDTFDAAAHINLHNCSYAAEWHPLLSSGEVTSGVSRRFYLKLKYALGLFHFYIFIFLHFYIFTFLLTRIKPLLSSGETISRRLRRFHTK